MNKENLRLAFYQECAQNESNYLEIHLTDDIIYKEYGRDGKTKTHERQFDIFDQAVMTVKYTRNLKEMYLNKKRIDTITLKEIKHEK